MGYFNRIKAITVSLDLLFTIIVFSVLFYGWHLPSGYLCALAVLSALLWVAIGFVFGKFDLEMYAQMGHAGICMVGVGLLTGGFIYSSFRCFVPEYASDYSILWATLFLLMGEIAVYYLAKNSGWIRNEDIEEIGFRWDARKVNQYHFPEPDLKVWNQDMVSLLKQFRQASRMEEIDRWLAGASLSKQTICIDSDNPDELLGKEPHGSSFVILKQTLNRDSVLDALFSSANDCLKEGGYLACNFTKPSLTRQAILKLGCLCRGVFLKVLFISKWPNKKGNGDAAKRIDFFECLDKAGFEIVEAGSCDTKYYVIASKRFGNRKSDRTEK